jgi:hypothetical protein
MFPKKSRHTVPSVRFIELTRSPCTRRENAELQPKVNVITRERKKVTVDRSILFRENSPKPPRNKPCGSNVKSAVT